MPGPALVSSSRSLAKIDSRHNPDKSTPSAPPKHPVLMTHSESQAQIPFDNYTLQNVEYDYTEHPVNLRHPRRQKMARSSLRAYFHSEHKPGERVLVQKIDFFILTFCCVSYFMNYVSPPTPFYINQDELLMANR